MFVEKSSLSKILYFILSIETFQNSIFGIFYVEKSKKVSNAFPSVRYIVIPPSGREGSKMRKKG
jgi:hypothetical protein